MIVRLFSQNEVKVEVKYMKCIITNWMNKLFVILVTLGLSSISSATDISHSNETKYKEMQLALLLENFQTHSQKELLQFENRRLQKENEDLKYTLHRMEKDNEKQSEDYYQLKLHLGLIILSVLTIILCLKRFVLIKEKHDNED